MLIETPTITEERGKVSITASILTGSRLTTFPKALWFKFPSNYRPYIADRSDGFLVGLLPSAMALGEDIVVEGPISPRLAYGIREYQRVLNAWWPDQYRIVNIEYRCLKESRHPLSQRSAGSSFSGGVDSFYTLYQHLPGNECLDQYALTHCLMINGFDKDVDLEERGEFRRLYQYYQPIMSELGITLLTSLNNLQHFRLSAIARDSLHHSFGAAITASALVLGNLFSRYYIPASHAYTYKTLIPMGAHPVLDHLLSTEGLQIIHDGAEATRTEKITTISEWPETYNRLRVCLGEANYQSTTGQLINCCRCSKCINTMLSLDLLEKLPSYSTFPEPLKRQRIWTAGLSIIRFSEHLKLAINKKRRDRIMDLCFFFVMNNIIAGFHVRIRSLLGTLGASLRFWQ